MFKKIIDFIKNIFGGSAITTNIENTNNKKVVKQKNTTNNDSSKKQTFNIKGNKAPIYILDNSIDKNNENKKENSNKSEDVDILSFKARKILKNGVESEGFIYTDNNDSGKLFCGYLKIDLFNISIKEKTEWIGAIEELESKGYIIGDKHNYGFYDDSSYDNSFEVTKKGFDFYNSYYKNRSVSELTYDIVDEWED